MDNADTRFAIARWVGNSMKRKMSGPDAEGFVVQELIDSLIELGWTPPAGQETDYDHHASGAECEGCNALWSHAYANGRKAATKAATEGTTTDGGH